MKKTTNAMAVLGALMAGFVMAPGAHAAEGPCEQIKAACISAGFAKGDAKQGNGLWHDCVAPIMQSKTQPKNATKPLPTIAPATVQACAAKHPKFGQGPAK